jgi:hypothetical protein
MKRFFYFPLLLLIAPFLSCKKQTATVVTEPLLFDSVPTVRPILPMVEEGSGLADSRKNPGFLWVQEDSGTPTQLT